VAAVLVRQVKMVTSMQMVLVMVAPVKNGLWVMALSMVAVAEVDDILLRLTLGTAASAVEVTAEILTMVLVEPQILVVAVVVVAMALILVVRVVQVLLLFLVHHPLLFLSLD
jgi:hypothetical protein